MRLFLFTASYPYGHTETFLDDEVLILSRQFATVEIIPLYGNGKPTRSTPANFVIHPPIMSNSKQGINPFIFVANKFNRVFWSDFFANSVYKSKKRLKTWAIEYRNTCIAAKSETIRNIEQRLMPDDICYYYWGKGMNLLSLKWKGRARHISRFHGEWDLWEESSGNYAPLREMLAKSLNMASFISAKGEQYFKEKYPFCPTCVSRLGAKDAGIAEKSSDDILRVVSCSAVYPLKRVPLIYNALSKMTHRQIEWTHIGGGQDFDALRLLIEENNYDHLKVNLLGRMPHEDVIKYYQNNKVDLFINVSTNEGIPVSIMEAASFNIPIVATNVGGTSEVVSSMVGELLPANPTENEIVNTIETVCSGVYSPRAFWNEEYNSEKNFTKFCEIIKSI